MDREEALPQPEEPRLSIMHLLVWTACVAIYFSFVETLTENGQRERASDSIVLQVLHGLAMGTALAGLVVLVSRRLRGVPLGKYPGRYLLLFFSVRLLCSIVTQSLDVTQVLELVHMPGLFEVSLGKHVLVAMAGGILYLAEFGVLILAAQRVKARRWRVFFMLAWYTLLLQYMLPGLMMSFGLQSGRLLEGLSSLVPQIATIVMLAAVLMDLRGREHYPWPHWMGVGLHLWFGAVTFASALYHAMVP